MLDILAYNIKYLRFREQMNQSQFARKLGLAKSTVSYLEGGYSNPTLDTLQLIADEFGLEAYQLIKGRLDETND